MKLKIKALITIFLITFISNVYAIKPKKKIFGNTKVETGTSTEEILPLLGYTAGAFGKYFERIYGQNRYDYVIIYMNRNKTKTSLEEMKKVATQMVKNVQVFFSSAKGRIELIASNADIWDSIEVKFSKGNIIEMKVAPSEAEINKKIKIRNQPSTTKYGLTEEQRKKFAYEHDALATWAINEAARKYPNEWDIKRYDYEDEIFYPKESEIFKKYGLTEKQAKDIIYNEAIQKKW